jgi:hypothetical protein
MSSLDLSDIISHNTHNATNTALNSVQIDKDTSLTHHGKYIGVLSSISEGVRCDCPVSNPSHSDGFGEDYAHTVRLGGGDIGVHCSGAECMCTYIPKSDKAYIDRSFDAVDDTSIVPVQKAAPQYWFDRYTQQYCLRESSRIGLYSKQGFTQVMKSFGAYHKDMFETIPSFYMDYDPRCGEMIDENTINTFKESPLMKVKAEYGAVLDVPKTIGLLLDTVFTDSETKHGFLNWLAFIFQRREKTGVVWVFKGVQGSGKGIIADTIMGGIFGSNMVKNLTDTQMNSQFNSIMEDRMVVHFNEISAENKRDRIAVKNKLKTWITDDTITINTKGVKEYEKTNFINIIINTNEAVPVDIDENDRRFTIVHTDTTLASLEWFKGNNTVDEIRKELTAFALYLSLVEADERMAKTAIVSEDKNNIIMATMSAAQSIANAIKSSNFDFFMDSGLEEYLIKTGGFYDLYEIEREFHSGDISNYNLGILISCVYGKEINPRSWSIMVMATYSAGERFIRKIDGKTIRGWSIFRSVSSGGIPF